MPEERCIEAYVAAWNEPDAAKRAQLLSQAMADDAIYQDPATRVAGRAAVSGYIAEVQAKYPGGRILRTSTVDVHHHACRFNWRVVRGDGKELPECVDFVDFAGDGRISRVTGFFGPPMPLGA